MRLYTPQQIMAGLSRRLRLARALYPNKYLRNCGGVIHIGGNDGYERDIYSCYNLPVLWVEALPGAFAQLSKNLQRYPKQKAVNALVTDKEGEIYDFNVSNNSGESSSIYDFGDHKKLWPEVVFTEKIKLRSTTLAAVLRDAGSFASNFTAVVLDVQGAELLVLKGAGDFLKRIRFVKAEVSDFEAYQGACNFDTLTAALKEWGFTIRRKDCFKTKEGVGSYYDVLYERAT